MHIGYGSILLRKLDYSPKANLRLATEYSKT
jgi:hypothetical protein